VQVNLDETMLGLLATECHPVRHVAAKAGIYDVQESPGLDLSHTIALVLQEEVYP
jgi:hypothetical protein